MLEEKQYDVEVFGYTGAINPKVDIYQDEAYNLLRVRFTQEMLSDKAGEPVTKQVTVNYETTELNFPKWFPKRLLKKWTYKQLETKQIELTVQPTWVYPNYALSTLGHPIGKYKAKMYVYDNKDPKPQPSDGPEYHQNLAAWEKRNENTSNY